MEQLMIVTHGGTETPLEHRDGCEHAAREGMQKLKAGSPAVDAVVAAVTALEADGRYDAGIGSMLGMDGKTIEMDAAVMDSRGTLGAVAALQEVRHPIQVARRVADTPHVLLVGSGATQFAIRVGLHSPFKPTDEAKQKFAEYVQEMQKAEHAHGEADDTESDAGKQLVKEFWNYPVPWQQAVERAGHGTVGAVARDAQGGFAVAVSTGGSPPSLLGRVADTPLIGCGFFAGEHGAVACTGIGEHVVRHMLAATVYRWIADGMPLKEALQRGVDLIPEGLSIGLIGVDRQGADVAARKPMASAVLQQPRGEAR